MLFILFVALMIAVIVRLIICAVKFAWGFAGILLKIVILPFCLVMMVVGGLIKFAIPVLAIIGVISLLDGSFS